MFKEAYVDTLENLSADFLHSFVTAILDDDVHGNGVAVVIELLM